MPGQTNLSGATVPSRDRVLEEVKQMVAEFVGLKADQIRDDSALIADLGYDSLDVVELAMELEEHFDISIPDDFNEQNAKVGQIADGIRELLAGAHAKTG